MLNINNTIPVIHEVLYVKYLINRDEREKQAFNKIMHKSVSSSQGYCKLFNLFSEFSKLFDTGNVFEWFTEKIEINL